MSPEELAKLDLAVAKAEGFIFGTDGKGLWHDSNGMFVGYRYQPTRDGAEAMRLMEKYRLWVSPDRFEGDEWTAVRPGVLMKGPTPAIAICRAVVALKKDDGRINWAEAMQTGKNRA